MAQIDGLREQQRALAEIKDILKEVEKINFFLKLENPSHMYELSFKVPVKQPINNNIVENTEEIVVNQEHLEGKESSNKKGKNAKSVASKRKARIKTEETHSVHLYCDDTTGLYHFVIEYKKQKTNRVLSLAEEYRIILDENDKYILGVE